MILYVYKSFKEQNLLEPENLIIPVFQFPKKMQSLLINGKSFNIYIFKSIPSQEVIDEYGLVKSVVLDRLNDNDETILDDLKALMLHKSNTFWKALAII